MNNPFRRTVRSEANPLDKCTIVSIYPKPIHETKPTIFPGEFIIPAGRSEKLGLLHVGPSSWWRHIDAEQPDLEIPVSSVRVADSIIRDYMNGLLGCNMGDCAPGIFFLLGELDEEEVRNDKKGKLLLEEAKKKQAKWFQALVLLADSIWSKMQNPLAISDDMRIAAEELQLKGKSWTVEFQSLSYERCKACGTLNPSTVIVCPNCKVIINQQAFKDAGLQFAT